MSISDYSVEALDALWDIVDSYKPKSMYTLLPVAQQQQLWDKIKDMDNEWMLKYTREFGVDAAMEGAEVALASRGMASEEFMNSLYNALTYYLTTVKEE